MKKKIAAGMIVYMLFCSAVGYCVKAYLSAPSKIVVTKNVKAEFHNTLWETVGSAMDVYGDERDIRKVIHDTIKINGMSSQQAAGLRNGRDVIIVPVEYERVVK